MVTGWRRNISKRILSALLASTLVFIGTDFTVFATEKQAKTAIAAVEGPEDRTAVSEEKAESDTAADETAASGETDGKVGGGDSGEKKTEEDQESESTGLSSKHFYLSL